MTTSAARRLPVLDDSDTIHLTTPTAADDGRLECRNTAEKSRSTNDHQIRSMTSVRLMYLGAERPSPES